MPSRLPLFPLAVVLFPGEPMPLHIFEPRYRRMLADCLEGNGRFGLTPDPSPRDGSVGTVAMIRAAEPLGDGRSNIVVLGERRFAVRSLLAEETPYLVGAVEEFDDQPGTAPLPVERQRLRELGDAYREALRVLVDSAADPDPWAEDGETFSHQVAALSELDLENKARLLALRSTRQRCTALIQLLPPLVREAERRAEVHLRARTNGKGHHGHDIVTDG
jgi:ATP-dependent Lon protease